MKNFPPEDALEFVSAIKHKNREKFQSFLQILNDYQAQRIDTRVLRLKVHQLFKGHKDLILRFNTFVPTQYELKLPLHRDDKQQQCRRRLEVGLEDGIAFLKRVRDVFRGENKGKYDEFLEMMMGFKAGRIDISVVVERVKQLFKGHTNLILEFNDFLPIQYEIKLPLDRDDKQQQCRRRVEVGLGDEITFLKRVRDVFRGENKEKYDEFLEMMMDFKARRIDISVVLDRVKELFKGHTDLILEFNAFLPTQCEIKLPLDHDDKQQQCRRVEVGLEDALAFIKRVRDVFQGENREKYDIFLEILKDCKARIIDISVAMKRVKELLKGHTNLILEFNAFL